MVEGIHSEAPGGGESFPGGDGLPMELVGATEAAIDKVTVSAASFARGMHRREFRIPDRHLIDEHLSVIG
jgi:hypothetical protein